MGSNPLGVASSLDNLPTRSLPIALVAKSLKAAVGPLSSLIMYLVSSSFSIGTGKLYESLHIFFKTSIASAGSIGLNSIKVDLPLTELNLLWKGFAAVKTIGKEVPLREAAPVVVKKSKEKIRVFEVLSGKG